MKRPTFSKHSLQVGMIIQLCVILFWSFHTHTPIFPGHTLWIIWLLALWKVTANDQRNPSKSRHKHTQTPITHTHTHTEQTKRSRLHSSVRLLCVCVSCRWMSELTRAFILEHVRSAALTHTHTHTPTHSLTVHNLKLTHTKHQMWIKIALASIVRQMGRLFKNMNPLQIPNYMRKIVVSNITTLYFR